MFCTRDFYCPYALCSGENTLIRADSAIRPLCGHLLLKASEGADRPAAPWLGKVSS